MNKGDFYMPMTGTTCNSKTFTKENIHELAELSDRLHTEFVQSFAGVPVRIDESLKGNHHYVAISRELYQQIMANKLKSTATP